MNGKPWWKSKTLWFNVGIVLVAIGQELAAAASMLSDAVQGTIQLFLALFVAVGNAILRIVTHEPLRVRK